MLLILSYILYRPDNPLFEGVLSYGAIFFDADGALNGKTSVGMNEELDGMAELLTDDLAELIDLVMRFVNIQVPRHGEVAVDVQHAAIHQGVTVVGCSCGAAAQHRILGVLGGLNHRELHIVTPWDADVIEGEEGALFGAANRNGQGACEGEEGGRVHEDLVRGSRLWKPMDQ